MTNDQMERRLSAALDKTAPDDVDGVLSRCTERKGTVVPMKKKNNRMKKWMQTVAACLAVLLLGGGGLLVQQAHAVTSVVSLDVNPSIELRVNSREKVVSCQALNQEAQAVLEDMDGGRDLKGVKADVAVNAIVGSLVRCGYLDSLSSAILISVEDKDQARAQRLQQELTGAVDGALAAGDSQAAVLSQTVQQDKELEKQAKANNISTGKAALIRQAMALNGSLTFEGLAQLSVEELRDLIEAGAPGMPIGMQAALEAAARYAGLTTADITDADVDPELDENPAHYEVEFQVPGKGELEYKVEAYTGQVLSGPANVQPSTPVNPSGDIGMEAAKSAALKHAGLSSAVFTKAERDYDDGRLEYELEFHTDSAAYEVTVDAANATRRLGVAVKCATITPNKQRMEEYPQLTQMWKSPNGTIRSILDGTVFRAPILIDSIHPVVKNWKKPITIARHAYGDVYKSVDLYTTEPGECTMTFKGQSGEEKTLLVQKVDGPAVWQGAHNKEKSIRSFARACFQYAIDTKQDLWFSTKDTIAKVYDGEFKKVFEEEFESYKAKFDELGITYFYTLIDDAVARVIRSQGGFIWACKNYDGDVMSDMVSTAFGSLAMMTSVLVSPDGTTEYEAAHGTVTKHYYKHLKGEQTSTNPMATIFAWSGALRKRGQLDGLTDLAAFADKLEAACFETLGDGIMTKDLVGLVDEGTPVTAVNSSEFIGAIHDRLAAKL